MTNIMPEPTIVSANDIPMAVYRAGDGPAVVMLHGFPELAYSWRHQIAALSGAGWSAIAPDLRGYGLTGCHGDVSAYRMENLARDIIGLLDALALPRAVIVGHDFGGWLAWTLARDHPGRIAGVVSLNTPYGARRPQDLLTTLRQHIGADHYMVRFQEPGVGEELLGGDIRAMFAALLQRPALTLEAIRSTRPDLRALPISLLTGEANIPGAPILSPQDIEIYAKAFRRTGFTGGLNWYRNLRRNWEDSEGRPDRIDVPALMISAENDIFLPPETTHGMEQHIPDLERALIASCGHWTQNDRPETVNQILIDWLDRRMRPLF
jgi:soluble epoxide hydrolase/lipid-phosphate phosphatase